MTVRMVKSMVGAGGAAAGSIRAWNGRRWAVAAALVASGLLAACGSTPSEDPNTPPEKLYAEAKEDMAAGAWDRAMRTLERTEARASGTLLGQQAMLDLAYTQWKATERVQALATLDRFIKLHPSSPALDYAYYLKGVINFNDNLGFLTSLSRQNMAERDQQASRDAFQAFAQLVERFPQSAYTADARLRMDYIANALAEGEVLVARYYFRRGAFLAAANRAQHAIREYPQSPALEEALYIMALSYQRLGLAELRDDADRVLKRNFPDTRFLRDGLPVEDKAWWQIW